jgi:hypothetical protein
MHHQDLVEIRAVGRTNAVNFNLSYPWQMDDVGSGDISFILANSKPRIVVDESGG